MPTITLPTEEYDGNQSESENRCEHLGFNEMESLMVLCQTMLLS